MKNIDHIIKLLLKRLAPHSIEVSLVFNFKYRIYTIGENMKGNCPVVESILVHAALWLL